MSGTVTIIEGVADVLIVADHASNFVPPDIDLGIAPALLDQHMAIDIGVAPLAAALCARLDCGAMLGGVSRLVIDLNREEDAQGLIPEVSDGHAIPGNNGIDPAERIARFWQPYHAAIARRLLESRPTLLVSLHSFTPQLASAPERVRPWQVGVLYNQDARAAEIAIPRLRSAGVVTGDNEPYSGKLLNATMNLHGEANGIPYLGLEVRQDLIGDLDGVAHWCGVLAPVIAAVSDAMR